MVALARELRRRSAPSDRHFAADVLAGLARHAEALPAKYFYDEAGSRLFERITELPEYYPTRSEMEHPARPRRRRSPS